jgi:glycosyltransferase involved in cell wall biosynthesis
MPKIPSQGSLEQDPDAGSSSGTSTDSSTNPAYLYVLMTSAHNEERTIEGTIKSIVSQNVQPGRWVIVSDNSTDRTDEIIKKYARKYDFIRYFRISRPPGRTFGAKVRALHQGCKLFEGCQYRFIGNVDADVSLEPNFFEDLIAQFERRPRLGLAGGYFYEEQGGLFKSRKGNRTYAVTHAAQLVRRECYEAIGGYAVLEYGGEDWHAETSARMHGWEIEAFSRLKIFHHRHTGEGGNLLRYRYRQGRMDYSFGCIPSFEILKCLLRLADTPIILGTVARLSGYFWSWIRRDKRPMSDEFVAFLRREEKARVAALLRGGDYLAWRRSHHQS